MLDNRKGKKKKKDKYYLTEQRIQLIAGSIAECWICREAFNHAFRTDVIKDGKTMFAIDLLWLDQNPDIKEHLKQIAEELCDID